jgi:hypothetical protein
MKDARGLPLQINDHVAYQVSNSIAYGCITNTQLINRNWFIEIIPADNYHKKVNRLSTVTYKLP